MKTSKFNRTYYLLPILLGSTFASSVFSAENNQSSIWIAGSVGMGTKDSLGLMDRNSSPSIKVSSGVDLGKNIGFFGSYDHIADITDNGRLNILSFGMRGQYPLIEGLSIYGKTGMSYMNIQREKQNVSGLIGVGLEYSLTNSISTHVGYDYYQDLANANTSVDINQWYWGLTYHFGKGSSIVVKSNQQISGVQVVDHNSTLSRSQYLVSFDTGESTLDSFDRYVLADLLAFMKQDPEMKAKIIGRTDKQGGYNINEIIANKRTNVVYEYLIDNGISPSRLEKDSVSNKRPLDLESEESPKSKLERSVQILLNY
ncbi:hypothetical protein BS333_07375 [Vibrio azureus]|uniref:OmpA-like domain-containing protein n=2 Tax=Vibrio azureus TaxID=512649 RepID=U3AWJ2_9VIBR|nr:OmpA family protein [Vibrio azureus]AUI86224.1 hypothetical protein BS333_07375 [Vibrio azureus]GAD78120.1 hypothetical protein VAZ01S_128_00030 [Vibrio azureus NBRC 104587]